MTKVTLFHSFDALPESYQALFAQAQSQGFYFGLPWYRNFLNCVRAPGDDVRIYGVNDADGSALAALPMWSREASQAGFKARCIESLQNYYTSLYAPALVEQDAQDSLLSLAHALKTEGEWDIVDLKPLDYGASGEPHLFQDMLVALRRAGFLVQPYFCFGNWFLKVAGRSFDAYYVDLPSQLKNTIKRKTKQFEAQSDNRIDVITGTEGLERALAAYETVYSASWKTPEPYPGFMPGFIKTCAAEGWLRMGVAYINDQPAAAQVWVVCNGTASIFKLAYDEQYSKFSVGSLLTTRLMRHVIDIDKVHTVDYLCGDDAYKRDWMSHRRERWGMMAFNPQSLGGLVAAARHIGGRKIKTWLQKLRAKPTTPLN